MMAVVMTLMSHLPRFFGATDGGHIQLHDSVQTISQKRAQQLKEMIRAATISVDVLPALVVVTKVAELAPPEFVNPVLRIVIDELDEPFIGIPVVPELSEPGIIGAGDELSEPDIIGAGDELSEPVLTAAAHCGYMVAPVNLEEHISAKVSEQPRTRRRRRLPPTSGRPPTRRSSRHPVKRDFLADHYRATKKQKITQ